MTTKIENLAEEYFRSGHNCAEAVFLAAVHTQDIQACPDVVRLATGFGGGMGRGEVCGALSGAILALGAVLGRTKAEGDQETLKKMREQVITRFEEELGPVQCRVLKTEDREDCRRYVRVAASALAAALQTK